MLNALGWSGSETVLPTYPQPIPSNWYDRTRNGHGIDFQKIATDTVYGDLYYVVFYTYTTANPGVLHCPVGTSPTAASWRCRMPMATP